MMSLNTLIEFGDAIDFRGEDYTGLCEETGFKITETLPVGGPASAAITYK